ncbi:hypothetical protein GO755_29665 [Spirosoma sp. HMF4905]|uniref:Uncharacterized protein n=1 Tax=Spirosoma arboris TaxID=2682092 RepID=A0A7K1SKD7_9BACT|nr:hypothetical protein [Spirosoma arboris]MVM34235.1 hypothetical protein [Spirosoma arboris]
MSNIATQSVHFFNNANTNIYNGTMQRDIILYPLTADGEARLEADIEAGVFTITLENGATLSPGTVPPLVEPSPPGFSAYSQTFTGPLDRYIYAASSGTTPTSTDAPFTGLPKTDTNYNFSFTYKTTLSSGSGVAGIKVNGVDQKTVTLEAATGGTRTVTGTLSLLAGNNTITFVLDSGTMPYTVMSFTITRAAGA